MKKIIQLIKNHPLLVGSAWITIGNVFISGSNYLFNLVMGNLMNPADYGLYASLISLSIIISLPAGVVTTVITKIAADFASKKKNAHLSRLSQKFTLYSFFAGIVGLSIFYLTIDPLSTFLKIQEKWLLVMIGVIVLVGFVSSVNLGLMRGLLLFKLQSVFGVAASVLKLVLGYLFVVFGWGVYGALTAYGLSVFTGWALSFYPVRQYFKEKITSSFGIRKQIFAIGFPSFSLNAAMLLFLSSDVLLVKHYFTSVDAGIFAAAAIMGKVVFYITGPIVQVFFPVITQRLAKKSNWKKDVIISVLLVGGCSAVVSVLFLIFPTFIQSILFPSDAYSDAAQYIGLYSVFMLFFSVMILYGNFFLAKKEYALVNLSLVAAIVQILGIIIFHETIYVVILVSIATTVIMTLIYSTRFILLRNPSDE